MASDQAVAGSNPAAPIRFPNDKDSTDGVDFLLKKSLFARKSPFRSITGVVAVVRFASANVPLWLQKVGVRGEIHTVLHAHPDPAEALNGVRMGVFAVDPLLGYHTVTSEELNQFVLR
mgnify:CR=1 FL=1